MRFNLKVGVLFIFSLLALSACSQDENKYIFSETSNNWVVKYGADFSFEYIGEDAAPAIFDYNLKSTWFELTSKEERFNKVKKRSYISTW